MKSVNISIFFSSSVFYYFSIESFNENGVGQRSEAVKIK